MSPGYKMIVSYYYSANIVIEEGDTISTASGSTSTVESTTYVYSGTEDAYVTITFGAGTSYITEIETVEMMDYAAELYVGTDKPYQTINGALDAISRMDRPNDERVTVMIDPGNYEEMLVITEPNVTLKNAATTPVIDLKDKGVNIGDGAVRITSYYGHGYSYYSMGADQKWHADILAVNKENGYLSYENAGAGTTNGSYWNATVVVSAAGFEAESIIFENSYNQYISAKEAADIVVEWETGGKGTRPTDAGNIAVQSRTFVERAAAIAFTASADKAVLDKCRVVGRQDSFFGSAGARVVVFKGAMMGAVDYIFGGMTAVFYKSDLVMNTSDESNDQSYLTAAQQTSGRGYLMYECAVKSFIPGVESASEFGSKPGYFGRPWQPATSEVVFYNTVIDSSSFSGYNGESLVMPVGWTNSLGGESPYMYEYGTYEVSGEDNSANRASWSTVLTVNTLSDGTEINTFNFTKGNDDWDPIPALVSANPTYSVTFNVTDGTDAIEGATVAFNMHSYTTDASGSVTVTDLDNANYNYTVSAEGYDDAIGSITVAGADVTENVTLDLSIGIEQNSLNAISLYPNPFTNMLTIANLNNVVEIGVSNILGKTIIKVPVTSNTYNMSTENLKNGVYLITIVDVNNNTRTERVVKQ